VTLARLDGIPTPAHGNEELFVLLNKKLPHRNFLIQWFCSHRFTVI